MNVLDLFSGAAGGWTLGLHRAGWTTVAACEVDPWRRAVFSRNWPEVVMFDDVRTLTARSLAGLGPVDAIVGSPPCQDASTANAKGKGVDGERTGLFFDAVRLVREVRPRWVCFENVPGLRARGYDRVHDALEAAGYAVRPLVVGAWHAGAFHRRNRVWIIANDANAAPMLGPALAGREPDGVGTSDARHPDQARLAQRQGEPGDTRPEQPAAFGASLRAWDHWNGGAPDLGRVDDGLSRALAARRGIGRACLAAYGDAVVPAITEMIGRAILAIEANDPELARHRAQGAAPPVGAASLSTLAAASPERPAAAADF